MGLLAGGLLVGFIFWRVWLYRKKVNAIPLTELKHIAIADWNTNQLLDGNQQIIAALSQVRITRKMQLTSSSPELLLSWTGGSISIAKGNPFSGGIGPIEQLLIAKGVRKG